MLKQERALVFFDLEATGVNPETDRIIEIAIVRREPDGQGSQFESLVNPGCPIPAGASEVNGITDEAVRDAPTFAQIAGQVLDLLADADLAGYNIAGFDVPLLAAELKRTGLPTTPSRRCILDAYRVFKRDLPHTLEGASRFYLGADPVKSHRALADVLTTIEVVDAQAHVLELADVPAFVSYLATKDPRFVDLEGKLRWAGKEAAIAVGKHAGQTLREAAATQDGRGYLEWMVGPKGNFPRDTVAIVRAALAGTFPVRPETEAKS